MSGNFSLALLSTLLYSVNIPGYGTSAAYKSPIFLGMIYGIYFGDVKQGIIVGATIQLMYLGLVATGNNIPADSALAGIIAIPIAMSSGLEPSAAVALGVPFGILGTFFNQIKRTFNIPLTHYADRKAAEGNIKEIRRVAFIYPATLLFLVEVIPVFILSYLGPTASTFLVEKLPAWVTGGLAVAGGVLPAIGFALMIVQLGRREILPYYFIGFFLVKYLDLGTMAVAIFGVCLALIVFFGGSSKNQDNNNGNNGDNTGEDEYSADYE